MTASHQKFPGLFPVFWPISTILLFGGSPLELLFPSPPVSVPILWLLYCAQRDTTTITVAFMFQIFPFSSKVLVLISLLTFLQFYPVASRNEKVHYSQVLFFVDYYYYYHIILPETSRQIHLPTK